MKKQNKRFSKAGESRGKQCLKWQPREISVTKFTGSSTAITVCAKRRQWEICLQFAFALKFGHVERVKNRPNEIHTINKSEGLCVRNCKMQV